MDAKTREEMVAQIVRKVYLGDAVYIRHDGFSYVLTTEDGIRETNTIYLERDVATALVSHVLETNKAIDSMAGDRHRIYRIATDGGGIRAGGGAGLMKGNL